ncbi:MAG: ABC transporter permease [Deltaproteobacteria bacterium]|nr:MAG: ABC transporter permease [Deltaproteobacteria bacterium]
MGAFYFAAKRVDYTWRWKRVPQYFFYKAELPVKADDDGIVTSIADGKAKSTVNFEAETGEKYTYKVDSETLNVSEGEDLFLGDRIGYVYSWEMGPLTLGIWTTLWISAVSGVLGLFLGIVFGLCRISKNPCLSGFAALYVELIRGTPLLVQIFIFYFFIGTVLDLDKYVAGVGALSLFAGAYVAEIIRAGIQSIARGQTEAARSLGMTATQCMVYIIMPQALKRTLPPLAGQFISLIKDSSLLSVIAIIDLTRAGREIISNTFATFEIWITVALLYLVITGTLSQLVQWMERRMAVSD